jgi:hypothetical protein
MKKAERAYTAESVNLADELPVARYPERWDGPRDSIVSDPSRKYGMLYLNMNSLPYPLSAYEPAVSSDIRCSVLNWPIVLQMYLLYNRDALISKQGGHLPHIHHPAFHPQPRLRIEALPPFSSSGEAPIRARIVPPRERDGSHGAGFQRRVQVGSHSFPCSVE